jgi:hypothetical protein
MEVTVTGGDQSNQATTAAGGANDTRAARLFLCAGRHTNEKD